MVMLAHHVHNMSMPFSTDLLVFCRVCVQGCVQQQAEMCILSRQLMQSLASCIFSTASASFALLQYAVRKSYAILLCMSL